MKLRKQCMKKNGKSNKKIESIKIKKKKKKPKNTYSRVEKYNHLTEKFNKQLQQHTQAIGRENQ